MASVDVHLRRVGDFGLYTPWNAGLVAVAGAATLERTVAERTRALRTSEARLKLATAGAGVGTWEADFSSGQGIWSPETMALLGVQQPGFTAESWLKEAVHPADRPRVAAMLDPCHRGWRTV